MESVSHPRIGSPTKIATLRLTPPPCGPYICARSSSLKLAAFVALMAASGSLTAQSTMEPIEVSPFVGYLFGGTVFKSDFPPPNWVPGNHVADHLNYGLRVGFNATSNIEPELEWSH